MLILLSGPIGSGKTTLCLRLVGLARSRGLGVSGVLAPAVIEDGVKVGIEAVDLSTDEARLLARLAQKARAFKGTRVGQYVFDDLALNWVVALCTKALAGAGGTAQDSLAFVDEIGKLELHRGKGLAPLIPLLAQPRDVFAMVIVRDTLLEPLLERVREADPRVVILDPQRREMAWTEITRLVFGGEVGL